jgi:ketosteroid isomerase-like protein
MLPNLDGIMAVYAPDVVAFDAFPPRKYVGVAAYRKDYEEFFAAYPGPVSSQVSDLTTTVAGSVAYAYGVDLWRATDTQKKTTDMTFRFTDILWKKRGKWFIVHEHVSFPVDPSTGAADFASKP